MRIAHIESSPHWGGQELRIIEQMEWLRAQGHPVWLLARDDAEILRVARERGLPHQALAIRNALDPGALLRLVRFIRRQRIELVDTHSSREGTLMLFVRALTGVKVVRSRHVSQPLKGGWLRRLAWRYGNDRVIVTAEAIRRQLVEAGFKREDAIDVVVAGVDARRFHPGLREQQGLRRQLGIPEDHRVVANIGMIRPDKGQLQFVRACRLIAQRLDRVSFIQAGEATASTRAYKEQVQAEAQRLGVAVRFLGYQADIERYLGISDVLVIASIGVEGQTRLVSQAFLTRTSVVATMVGGLPEMIVPEQTGLLCEPGSPEALAEAVTGLLNDPDRHERLRRQAYEHARRSLTLERMMDQQLAGYRRCWDRRQRPAAPISRTGDADR